MGSKFMRQGGCLRTPFLCSQEVTTSSFLLPYYRLLGLHVKAVRHCQVLPAFDHVPHLGSTRAINAMSPAMRRPTGLLQLPWQLSGLLEDAPHDDMELTLSILGRGEGGAVASGVLPALKDTALAVMDCSMVTEAPDREGWASMGPSGASWGSVTNLQPA